MVTHYCNTYLVRFHRSTAVVSKVISATFVVMGPIVRFATVP